MSDKNKPVSVGGQALMEGIMMRGPKGTAMSLRLPDGNIETTMKKVTQLKDKYKFFGWPFIRGVVGFIESMILGYSCLMESAEKTSLEKDDDEENMSKFDKWLTKHFGPKMMTVIGAFSAIIGFALAFFLFYWLPSFTFDTINKAASGSVTSWRTIIEGVIRITIFVVYMVLVAKMKDIKRLYMYHGAEHKAIFCFESGEKLTVDNVRKQTRFHPRCGTSFIFVMIILSILISSIIALSFPALTKVRALWMVVKVLLIPIIMSIGYEFIKYAGNHQNVLVKTLSAPGLWMQRITTKEPTDDIIEVGIAALKAVIQNPEPISNIADTAVSEEEADQDLHCQEESDETIEAKNESIEL